MITATINGKHTELAMQSLAAFIATKNLKPLMVVIEHNGTIVPREQFETVIIADNDEIEIVQMMAGG